MKINSDKAEQHLRHLHIGIWQVLFTAVREQRNIFLHGKDSISMKYKREILTTELWEWKRVPGSRLGYQQMYLVNYSNDEITHWKTTTMKETIHQLVKAAALQEAYMLDIAQQRMTDFFDPIDFDSIKDDVWM